MLQFHLRRLEHKNMRTRSALITTPCIIDFSDPSEDFVRFLTRLSELIGTFTLCPEQPFGACLVLRDGGWEGGRAGGGAGGFLHRTGMSAQSDLSQYVHARCCTLLHAVAYRCSETVGSLGIVRLSWDHLRDSMSRWPMANRSTTQS